jgi:hypothetical protein
MSNVTRIRIEQYVRLEARIQELGGTLPRPWPWDTDGTLRNLQLLELVEDLERHDRKTQR